jgi:hypothetical protein
MEMKYALTGARPDVGYEPPPIVELLLSGNPGGQFE